MLTDYEECELWLLGQRLAALDFDVDALLAELAGERIAL